MIILCGILLFAGGFHTARIQKCLPKLEHRGPDDAKILDFGHGSIGFVRLSINGEGKSGEQPYGHGRFIGVFNGEIYNYKSLIQQFSLGNAECDTHIILSLFEKLGPKIIEVLDGFYSGIILDKESGQMWCLRGHIGKKPLFIGYSEQEWFLSSELKVLGEVSSFEAIPLGVSTVDLETGEVIHIAEHVLQNSQRSLVEMFQDAVVKRLPSPEQKVGVFLSGGLDSSLVAAIVSKHRPDAHYFILGSGADNDAVDMVIKSLKLENIHYVKLPEKEKLQEILRSVVKATESYNPSIVTNGLGTYLLAQAVRARGIKVVLGGEGADELFGGYHQFQSPDEPWEIIRRELISDMQFTELRRLDLASMAHSIEVRCPFLDAEMRSYSDGLPFEQMYHKNRNKVHLRTEFSGFLPNEILWRPKTSLDVGSGVRELVTPYLRRNGRTERNELKEIWEEIFAMDSSEPYFSSYPVFDAAIDERGVAHK